MAGKLLITPNAGSTTAGNDPKIQFQGTGNSTDITLRTTTDGSLSFEGSSGQLFSISDSMSGTIFSANDVSGIPSIEVLDTGLVKLAQYSGNVVIGSATDDGASKLQVTGVIKNQSTWISDGTTNNAYNENIRLFAAGNGGSTIAFNATGISGTPVSSLVGWSDRLEFRFGGTSKITLSSADTKIAGGAAMTGGWNRSLLLSDTFPGIVFNSNSSKYAGISYDYSSNFVIRIGSTTSDVFANGVNALTLNATTGAATFGSSVTTSSTVSGNQLIATVATGTAPLTVASTTVVTNLNANYLNGYAITEASSATTAVARNSAGDINVRLVRSEFANEATISGGIVFRVNNSTDNYLRICSDAAAIRTFIGAQAAGSYQPADTTYTFTKSIQVTTSWVDTGIIWSDMSYGTYIMQMYVENMDVGGQQYYETYSGIISWYAGASNSTEADEIALHKSGHAPNGHHIFLRTIRQTTPNGIKLQICSTVATTAVDNYQFKFRRFIA